LDSWLEDYLFKISLDRFFFVVAHYALASRNTDLAVYLLKVMIDVTLSTFDAHNGL
jgi:hypothetical protein